MGVFRIYVASLSDYNNTILHGVWLDLVDYNDLEELQEAVQDMLAKSPTAAKYGEPAEEYAIHDYEGFPYESIAEYSSLSAVWEQWERYEQAELDDNLEAFMAYEECCDGDYEAFQEAYRGHYDSERDFAEELLEETGELNAIPEHLRYYFDYDAYARELFAGDFTMQDGYVFWNY